MNKSTWTAERIEKFRKSHRLTRKALGQLLGVTVTTVYQWERRLRNPSRTTQILLSRIEEEMRTKKGKEAMKSWGSGQREKAGRVVDIHQPPGKKNIKKSGAQ